MTLKILTTSVSLNATVEEAFAWHERPGAVVRLIPPWKDVAILETPGSLADGERAVFEIAFGPFRRKWIAEHYGYSPNERFCDTQVEGPFGSWKHRHLFEREEHGGCRLTDDVEYELPMDAISTPLAGGFARRELEAMFRFRHAALANDLRRHKAAGLAPSRFLISGSTGLVGGELTAYLRSGGHQVTRLVRDRRHPAADEISWNPDRGFEDDTAALEGFDFVVHLAGAGIADRRWTAERKALIRDSRVTGTRNLVSALTRLAKPPRALLCASAVGIYGETGDAWVDESSLAAKDFLAITAGEWEGECKPAAEAGIRVANLRLGVVLTPRGGALAKMLTPFRFGLGGRLGNGRMFVPWVSIDDVLGAFGHCAARDSIAGPVNVVAPNPVRNAEFTRTLANVLGRPVGPPVPGFALKAVLGEIAEEAVLKSTRAKPMALLESGYEFTHPRIVECLRHVLGR